MPDFLPIDYSANPPIMMSNPGVAYSDYPTTEAYLNTYVRDFVDGFSSWQQWTPAVVYDGVRAYTWEGRYTRVGTMVFARGCLVWSSITSNGSSTPISVTLPVPATLLNGPFQPDLGTAVVKVGSIFTHGRAWMWRPTDIGNGFTPQPIIVQAIPPAATAPNCGYIFTGSPAVMNVGDSITYSLMYEASPYIPANY